MKKRVIIIVSIIAAIVILVLGFIWIILPRLFVYKATEYLTAVDDKPAEYFTDYDVKPDFECITVDNGMFSVSIPENYTSNDPKEDDLPLIYRNSDKNVNEAIILTKIVGEPLNMLEPENYEDMEDIYKNTGLEQITEGFEKIGNGLPDSSYNTYKCAALLERDDYSFWDLEKAVAFSVMGMFKEIAYYDCDIYIYEQDSICGILTLKYEVDDETNLERYKAIFQFYSTDNLDTSYTLMVYMNSLDDIYAIINTVEII